MSIADVCDVAEAALVEQFEADQRAYVAAGSDESVADARQRLLDVLHEEPKRLRAVDRDELELRRALGVA